MTAPSSAAQLNSARTNPTNPTFSFGDITVTMLTDALIYAAK